MSTPLRNALAFALIALLLPTLFVGFTGSPGWLIAWGIAATAIIFAPSPHDDASTVEQRITADLDDVSQRIQRLLAMQQADFPKAYPDFHSRAGDGGAA